MGEMKKLTRQDKEAIRKLASRGGTAAANKLTDAEKKERSRKGNEARWSKKKKSEK